ncbi:LysR family transcriptional regulator [Grimontia marina]|uniref:HTH-type transcriptional regulator DmlR n=1 Tax=Grimontia marina TaxID=646534 RepID=A0A128FII0_9GAMM|nr:LysR family transcriptional regulator [Grimontia marina]CZF86603.1 HTH-type transcriptional regulator DmlR [Grimontia marina]
MNLRHLETFKTVAELSSFSKAADVLGVSKGLVSRHIRALESELACRLFFRTTRSVVLTEPGKELFGAAQQIDAISHKAAQSINMLTQDGYGYIRFTAPDALGPIIAETALPAFSKGNPNIHIELDFTTDIKDVEFGESDVALRSQKALPDNLVARDIGALKDILVCSPSLFEKHEIRSSSDLLTAPCLKSSFDTSWNNWTLHSGNGQSVQLTAKGQYSSSSYEGLIALAAGGLGVACIPLALVEKNLSDGSLMRVLPDWFASQHQLHLVYTHQRFYPKKLREFIDAVVAWRNANSIWFIT